MQLILLVIFSLMIAISAVIFALQNPGAVGIKFLEWESEGSLALILLITFSCGFLTCSLIAAYVAIKNKWVNGSQKKKEEPVLPAE